MALEQGDIDVALDMLESITSALREVVDDLNSG
jgi:hypothetical protein